MVQHAMGWLLCPGLQLYCVPTKHFGQGKHQPRSTLFPTTTPLAHICLHTHAHACSRTRHTRCQQHAHSCACVQFTYTRVRYTSRPSGGMRLHVHPCSAKHRPRTRR